MESLHGAHMSAEGGEVQDDSPGIRTVIVKGKVNSSISSLGLRVHVSLEVVTRSCRSLWDLLVCHLALRPWDWGREEEDRQKWKRDLMKTFLPPYNKRKASCFKERQHHNTPWRNRGSESFKTSFKLGLCYLSMVDFGTGC